MTQFLETTPELYKALAEQLEYHGAVVGPSTTMRQVLRTAVTVVAPQYGIEEASISRKQTSPEISSMAARYMSFNPKHLMGYAGGEGTFDVQEVAAFCSDIRRMAASLVSQDETPKGDDVVGD